jgi:hypothetical protein
MDTCPPDAELAIHIVNATPKPTFVTPNLDAIKKLRKRRGVSRKSHLIGVPVEVHTDSLLAIFADNLKQDMDTSHTPGGQQAITLPISTNTLDSVPDAPVDATTHALLETIIKGVDITLKKMFANSQFSPNTRLSPRRRKAQIDEVEALKASESKEDHCFMLVSLSHFKIWISSQLTVAQISVPMFACFPLKSILHNTS